MIIVCGLHDAQKQIDLHQAKSVIGILGPESVHPDYVGIAARQHLKLTFNDINHVTEGLQAVTDSDTNRLLRFLRNWDQQVPLLIHCWAGISRSTASAYAALCFFRDLEDEFDLARELRAASPSATPNRLITALVDKALGRDGRMVAAIESIGRGADAFAGAPFILSI